MFAGLSACRATEPGLEHVTVAEVAIEPLHGNATDASSEPPSDLVWHRVTLPHVESPRPANVDGSRVGFWVRFTPAATSAGISEPLALTYSAYLVSGRRATLYVGATPVASTDDSRDNSWNQPVLLTLPPERHGGSAPWLLRFSCVADLERCGVPSLQVGPLPAAARFFDREQFWRVDGARIGSLAMLAVGGFAILFWLRQRQATVYLLFACAAVLWVLRSLHYHLPHYPQPDDLFWWMTDSSLNWLAYVVYLFAFRLRDERRPRTEAWLLGTMVTLTVLAIPVWPPLQPFQDALSYAGQSLTSLVICALLTRAALRTRAAEQIVLAAALWITLIMGVHDALLQFWVLNMEGHFWLPYGAVPIFGSFIFALARRYSLAIETSAALNASLEERLAARQAELQRSYEQLRAYELDRAQGEERARLMREMHDGVGSTLISTLASVEHGEMARDEVVSLLRGGIDELRLMIDSLEPVGHDLVTLLATLRYRLGPRLERLGLTVEWRMADLPALPWLDAAASLQILRIVQESITNVIKHAQARRLTIQTELSGGIVISVADDGRGFAEATTPGSHAGHGLANLRQRAAQLGAALQIDSTPTGTVVRLILPLERTTANGD